MAIKCNVVHLFLKIFIFCSVENDWIAVFGRKDVVSLITSLL